MKSVDERFAYFTNKAGEKFQVLQYRIDEETKEEVPYDWDEKASAELMNK